jgi:hypothetical protein
MTQKQQQRQQQQQQQQQQQWLSQRWPQQLEAVRDGEAWCAGWCRGSAHPKGTPAFLMGYMAHYLLTAFRKFISHSKVLSSGNVSLWRDLYFSFAQQKAAGASGG